MSDFKNNGDAQRIGGGAFEAQEPSAAPTAITAKTTGKVLRWNAAPSNKYAKPSA
jgi:hypothetical protein